MDIDNQFKNSVSEYVYTCLTSILEPDTFNRIIGIIINLDKLDSFNLIYFKNNIEYNPLDRFEDQMSELFNATEDRGAMLVNEIIRLTRNIVNEVFEAMTINCEFEYLHQINNFLESLYEFIWTTRLDLIDELKEVIEEEDEDDIIALFYDILNRLTGCGNFYLNEVVFDTSTDFIKTLISRNNDINENDNINVDEYSYKLLKNLPIEYIDTNVYKRIVNDEYDIDVNLVDNLKALYRDIDNDNKIIENCVIYLLLSHDSRSKPIDYIDTIDFTILNIENDNIDNYKQLIKNELNRIKL